MPYKLSPSSLNLFQECHRCFWLQLNKKQRRPNGPFPSLPSGMDKLLKGYFDKYFLKNELPPELVHLNGSVKPFNDLETLKKWQNNFSGIVWQDKKGNTLHGAVDSMLMKGKKLIVLDFKTRGFALKEDTAAHYQLQLDTYNLLLKKNKYQTENYGYLLFYIPESIKSGASVKFLTELIKRKVSPGTAEQVFKDAIRLLDRKEPKITSTCDYCAW